MERVSAPVRVEVISAGKFRRFSSMPMWQQLLRVKTIVWPNIRDGFKFTCGFMQSFAKLIIWRPDVVFCKGGYVCLPAGMAAHILRIPIVIHDSDAHPGLTNSILSKWAVRIATGAPLEHYSYSADKAAFVGIPIDERLHPYTEKERTVKRESLGFRGDMPLVVITGGGLGAASINTAITKSLVQIIDKTQVLLISGAANHKSVEEATKGYASDARFQLHGFVGESMVDALIAADIVVTRAGATTLLELAALAKPTILVPNPYLAAGHQVKNARIYQDKNAAIVLADQDIETNSNILTDAILELLDDRMAQKQLGDAIYTFARPDAAKDVAEMIRRSAKRAK